MNVVGKEKIRVDAYGKVTGEAKYTADLEPVNILTAKVLHSTIANGVVKGFDLSEAEKVQGVVKIVTCFDVPEYQFPTAGHPWSTERSHRDICDRKLLNTRVRFYGDDIAAVIAQDEIACDHALRAIRVEYEEYPPVPDIESALGRGASVLHPDLREDNVIAHTHMTMGTGDFTYEAGMKKAEEIYGRENLIVVEKEYRTPRVSHCHIELPTSFAYQDVNGKITIVSSTQIPHIVRRVTAQALGCPAGKVRVIKPYIGGGFGNKQDVLYEPLNAYLSLQAGGRAVRLEIDRENTISATRTRHEIIGKCRAVATKDGKILARKIEAYANNGGYASHGHAICANCCTVFKNLYADRLGCEADGYTVYTSSAVGGAMRGYGIPQSVFFAESLTDDICAAAGADPLEFRMANCMPEHFVDPGNGIGFHSYGLKKCMETGAEYIRWEEKREKYKAQTGPVRRGIGMAMFCYKTGVHPISLETASCRLILNQDGSAQLSVGATEIGQGADTVFTQMAAETTGISCEDVYVISMQDTDVTPFDTGAYASRQSYVSGMAVKKCGQQFKEKILEYAAYMLNSDIGYISRTVYADIVRAARTRLERECGHSKDKRERIVPEMLDIRGSRIVCAESGNELFSLSVLADTAFYSLDRSVHITAECTNQCRDNTLSSGCCFVEVEVDMPLGLVEIKDIVNVHDSGTVLNPELARAQVHGGMSMGLGYGLSEELLYNESGRPLNNNLLDYKIPTAMDTPKLNVKFIEIEDPTGPYGNKSLGEPPVIPVAPAVRNAILHATGVAMDELPATSQRLVAAFKEHGLI